MAYEKDSRNHFIYPKKGGVENYLTDDAKEIYLVRKNLERYAFNYDKKHEIYALNEKRNFYYVKRKKKK